MPSKQVFQCPLCGSSLPSKRYYEIIGVWEERQKLEGSLKRELQQLHAERKRLQEENKKVRKEMRKAVEEATKRGKQAEKKRAEKLSAMIQGKAQQIQLLTRKVKDLQEQLEKGTTPQVEGLNYELELVKDLRKHFPHDRIEHHGKAGDILHIVMHRSQVLGRILFECKKTTNFSRSYVHQTRKAVAKRKATYGVLVTFASKKGAAGFWVDGDILVVHPLGALHVADVLRRSIMEIYSTRISAQEANRRAVRLMEYVKGDDFKNLIGDTIYRTNELYELLKKEVNSHKKIWRARYDHYLQLHVNSTELSQSTTSIVRCGKPIRQVKGGPKALPPPSI